MPEPKLSAKTKEEVARRAAHACEYCRNQARFSSDPFSIEHTRPRSRGGTDENSNLALSCQGCNSRKYTSVEAIDPVTGETVPLFNPREHEWGEDFVWNDDYTSVCWDGHRRAGRRLRSCGSTAKG